MKRSTSLLAVLLLLTAGCSTSNPSVPQRAIPAAMESSETVSELAASNRDLEPEPEPPADPDPAPGEPAAAATPDPTQIPVATIGGEVISLAELLSTWVMTDSQGLRDMLERMTMSRLVAMEASRLGIEEDPELIRQGYADALVEMEGELRLQQPDMTLDQWVTEVLGLDPREYRLNIQQEVKRRYFAERVVRAFVYSQQWAEVRVIVTETQEEAQAAMTRVREGEPFARVAAEVSIDPGGQRGGKLPPVLRNDTVLARLAFDTEVGELAGPRLEEGRRFVIQTDDIHAPLSGDWGEIAPRIESSLKERPIEDPEYWMWKVEMRVRHPVDFGPFFELVDVPTPEGPVGG